jgi:hypothetical protein
MTPTGMDDLTRFVNPTTVVTVVERDHPTEPEPLRFRSGSRRWETR